METESVARMRKYLESLTPEERKKLFDKLAEWYKDVFSKGEKK